MSYYYFFLFLIIFIPFLLSAIFTLKAHASADEELYSTMPECVCKNEYLDSEEQPRLAVDSLTRSLRFVAALRSRIPMPCRRMHPLPSQLWTALPAAWRLSGAFMGSASTALLRDRLRGLQV